MMHRISTDRNGDKEHIWGGEKDGGGTRLDNHKWSSLAKYQPQIPKKDPSPLKDFMGSNAGRVEWITRCFPSFQFSNPQTHSSLTNDPRLRVGSRGRGTNLNPLESLTVSAERVESPWGAAQLRDCMEAPGREWGALCTDVLGWLGGSSSISGLWATKGKLFWNKTLLRAYTISERTHLSYRTNANIPSNI